MQGMRSAIRKALTAGGTGSGLGDAYPKVGRPALARTAGRYPAGRFYDDLARLATGGRFGAEDVLHRARNGDHDGQHVDPRTLAWFGHVTASRTESETRIVDALRVFDWAYAVGGDRILVSQLDSLWVQAAYLAGELERYQHILRPGKAADHVWWAAEADTLHPDSGGKSEGEWLEVFNRPLADVGLEPIHLMPGDQPAFDRIDCAVDPIIRPDMPLVSVVVPVYNPGPSLETTVRSLIGQTWTNLEILLSDDGSTTGRDLLDELAQRDPRIRVIHAKQNGGAYAARNLGMREAVGEFVTFNDADDWSHPRRIERQVRAFENKPEIVASLSGSIRATEDLALTVIGRPTRRANLSSLLFRRDQVISDLGAFDAVRRGGDSEFLGRLSTVYGENCIERLADPLAFVQLTAGSLSRDDYLFLRTHPARLQYVADFTNWHRKIGSGECSAHVKPGARAPFPAPAHIAGTPAADPVEVDVVMLANLGQEAPTVPDLAAEVAGVAGRGLRTGLVEFIGPFDTTARVALPSGHLADLIASGDAIRILPGERVSSPLTVVRDPAAIETMPDEALAAIKTETVVVIADYGSADGRCYDPAYVSNRLHALLDAPRLRWIPATEQIAADLREAIGSDVAMAPTLAAALSIDSETNRSEPVALPVTAVIPGSVHGMSVKELATQARQLLPKQTFRHTAIWAAGRRLRSLANHGIRHLDPSEVSLDSLLDQVDAVYVAPAIGRGPHLDPVAVRAMISGRIVALDPSYRGHFGDAAVYLDGTAATSASLASLLADPEARREHNKRVADFVRSMSAEAFVANLDQATAAAVSTEQIEAIHEATTRMPIGKVSSADESPPPLGALSETALVVTVTSKSIGRLRKSLQHLQRKQLRSTALTVVHAESEADAVHRAVHGIDRLTVTRAVAQTEHDIADLALQVVRSSPRRYACVSDVPKVNTLERLTKAVRSDIKRLAQVELAIEMPLLVGAIACPADFAAKYVATCLDNAEPSEAGRLNEYLAGVVLAAADPRLEAVDPAGTSIDLLTWMDDSLPATLDQPAWMYRLVLVDQAGREVSSEPASLVRRVDKEGVEWWDELHATIPLERVRDGNHNLYIEVATLESSLRFRRELRPRNGVLLSSRTVEVNDEDRKQTIRYLVYSTNNAKVSRFLVQAGRGRLARLRWAGRLIKKDIGFIVRRRGGRKVRALRLARLISRPVFARRNVWLVGERTDTAQDNGYQLFRHLRTAHPERDVFYVIDRSSVHYDRVAKYGNVVAHSSWKHKLLFLHASVLANAYSIHYMLPKGWGQAAYARNLAWRVGALRVYLKHGVHLSPNAVKRGSSGYDLYLTVMPAESEAIREVSGYDKEIAEVGLPRYDSLTPVPETRRILFMATWRRYLVPSAKAAEAGTRPGVSSASQDRNPATEVSEQPFGSLFAFDGSAYDQFVNGLLRSERLHEILASHNYTFTFLPHYNMSRYFKRSVTAGERIDVADTDSVEFQDLLRNCDAFITDYSSVHFDVAYLGIPLVYARFDERDFETRHAAPSWFNYYTDGFGPVTHTLEETIDEIERLVERECAPDPFYTARVDAAFPFRDTNNCVRVVSAIDSRLAEIAKSDRG